MSRPEAYHVVEGRTDARKVFDLCPRCTKVGRLPEALSAACTEQEDVVAVRVNGETL